MIFVTVGTQGPFDRLIGAVDDWAARHPDEPVVAQIGDDAMEPRHARSIRSLGPDEFRRLVKDARVVVAHAGMGTILTALEYGKPLIVMPRRASLGEQRNDHQLDTARKFEQLGRIRVVHDSVALARCIEDVGMPTDSSAISNVASGQLIQRISDFIRNDART